MVIEASEAQAASGQALAAKYFGDDHDAQFAGMKRYLEARGKTVTFVNEQEFTYDELKAYLGRPDTVGDFVLDMNCDALPHFVAVRHSTRLTGKIVDDLPALEHTVQYIDYQLDIPFFRQNYDSRTVMRRKLDSDAYKAVHRSYVTALDAHDEQSDVPSALRQLVEDYFNGRSTLGWPSVTDVPMLAFQNEFVNNNAQLRDAMSFKLLKVSTPPPSPPSDAEETKAEAEVVQV